MSNSRESNDDSDHAISSSKEKDFTLSGAKSAPSFKHRYKNLKRKLKFLLYEQECFREELTKVQKRILRVSMDKSFLLDRLLKYENVPLSSSDENGTATSSNESEVEKKKKKTHHSADGSSNKASKSNKEKKKKAHASKKSLHQHGSANVTKEATDRTKSKDGKQIVQCAYSANGQQCQEMVSKSSKLSYCDHHRTVIRIGPKNGNDSTKSSGMLKYSVVKKERHSKKSKERKKTQGEFSRLSSASASLDLPTDVFNDSFEDKVEEPSSELQSSLDDLIEEDLVIDLQD